MHYIADRIREAMTAAGLSEAETAESAGIPRVTFRRRLADPRGLTLDELERIGAALGIEFAALVFRAAS